MTERSDYTELVRLKALAHPLRAELYSRLTAAVESTATRLAEQVAATPSLVSYHLRELAKYGFVESFSPDSGDKRDRWWRVLQAGVTFPAPQETAGAERVLLEQVESVATQNQLQRFERFRQSRDDWGARWAAAAFSADFLLKVTPDQLEVLYHDLEAVILGYLETLKSGEALPAEAETVTVLLHGFPIR